MAILNAFLPALQWQVMFQRVSNGKQMFKCVQQEAKKQILQAQSLTCKGGYL